MQDIDIIAQVINKKATIVTSMPASPNEGTLVMFLGTSNTYITGGLYKYVASNWQLLYGINKVSDLQNDAGYITLNDIPAIPSKTSDLQNDSGFITLSDIPAIPSKTSDLQNDSGFITASDNVATATYATSAGTAASATTAGTATTAGSCTGTAAKATTYSGNCTIISSTTSISTGQAVDRRYIVTANVTLTLGTATATNGVIAEVFATSACTISYASTTLSMAANTRATFVYYSGWKYLGVYGAVWN